jgi:hypothetical protein
MLPAGIGYMAGCQLVNMLVGSPTLVNLGSCASARAAGPRRSSGAGQHDPRRSHTRHPSCHRRTPCHQIHWACDLQLVSAAVSAACPDSASSHPGRAYFSLPRTTCVCALQTVAPQRCRKWNICIDPVSIRYRSAISSDPALPR